MKALLNAFLGRNMKTSKFKTLARLAISRATVFKNQRQVRFSHAKSDAVELLRLGHQERALLRVEQVIKEQNMMDVFTMIEDYCYLLIDRVMLLKKERECHDEIKEAVSSLIFASSRCGEFPELKQLRWIFVTNFGKEFAARAAELRNNCGVSPKIIQKLSTRQPSLEIRLKALQEIASAHGVVLQFVEDVSVLEEKWDAPGKQKPEESSYLEVKWYDMEYEDEMHAMPKELKSDDKLSESLKSKKEYRDVAAAALEAFQSAVYAAAAARAAVELSRLKSRDNDQDDNSGFTHKGRSEGFEYVKNTNNEFTFEKIYPIKNTSSESESEDHIKELEENKNKHRLKDGSTSCSDSDWNIPSTNHQDLDFYIKHSLTRNEIQNVEQSNAVAQEYGSDEDRPAYRSSGWNLMKSNADTIKEPSEKNSNLKGTQKANRSEQLHSHHSRLGWLLSVRTKRVQRQ